MRTFDAKNEKDVADYVSLISGIAQMCQENMRGKILDMIVAGDPEQYKEARDRHLVCTPPHLRESEKRKLRRLRSGASKQGRHNKARQAILNDLSQILDAGKFPSALELCEHHGKEVGSTYYVEATEVIDDLKRTLG